MASFDHVHALQKHPAAAELAWYWQKIACLEHASVASFARTILQLMACGAPAELLHQTTRAMQDEVRHTQLAATLAECYGAPAGGPGAFPLGGDMSTLNDPGEVLEHIIREACVDETLAAAEVAVANELATDEPTREVLAIISEDEANHAALGWKTLSWLLQRYPELLQQAGVIFQQALASKVWPPDAIEEVHIASTGGKLDSHTRAKVQERIISDVIRPCAKKLGLVDDRHFQRMMRTSERAHSVRA
jgi:hypothetical protein